MSIPAPDIPAVGIAPANVVNVRELPPPSFQYLDPRLLQPPLPDLRDRTTKSYRSYLDDELRPDARQRGIQVPLLVHRDGEFYRVIDGGTRREVALLEGITQVPVLVFASPLSDPDIEIAKFQANEKRLDLSPRDKARFYRRTMQAMGWNSAQMCRKLFLNPATVSKALKWLERLLPQYHDKVGEAGKGMIPERAAYVLADFPPARQEELAEKIMAELLTVEALEAIKLGTASKPKAARPTKAKCNGASVVLPGDWNWDRIKELGHRLVAAAGKGEKGDLPPAILLASLLK